jgi:hypothetical protein
VRRRTMMIGGGGGGGGVGDVLAVSDLTTCSGDATEFVGTIGLVVVSEGDGVHAASTAAAAVVVGGGGGGGGLEVSTEEAPVQQLFLLLLLLLHLILHSPMPATSHTSPPQNTP